MIVIGICFGLASYFALTGINRILATFDGPSQFRFFPKSAIWWFFPGFGALSLCWEITLQLWSIFAGRNYVNFFSDWTNNSTQFWGGGGAYAGIDSRKVLRWMSLLITLPIGIFTILALNMHTVMSEDGIRECGYAFKPCAVHPYATIRRITKTEGRENRDGRFIAAPAIVLDYSDGRRWSSDNWRGTQASAYPALLDFLGMKTHLNFEHQATESDIPPMDR